MIHTKVARIVDSRYLILAAGREHGVREGMEFIIYDLGDPVLDPETGSSLGQLELIKGRVKIFHVQDKLSHAEAISRMVTETVDPLAGMQLFRPQKVTRTVYDELKIEGAIPIVQNLTIRIGDRARTIE